jgi:DNA-binding LacI/PurR family transcriptional regulator
VSGYRRSLKEHAIPLDETLIVETPFSVIGGYQAANMLLSSDSPPTAIFARSDRHALGVLHAANKLSIAVPDELSIVGHDDEPDAEFWNPPLTTIRQPQYEMGTKAATLLFERMNNHALPPRQAIIQPQLIIRETTAPPLHPLTIRSKQEELTL